MPLPTVILTERDLKAALGRLMSEDAFVFDVETVGPRRGHPKYNEITWLNLATHDYTCTIPMGHPNGSNQIAPGAWRKQDGVRVWHPPLFDAPPEQLPREHVMHELTPLFLSPDHLKIAHNGVFDAASMQKYLPAPVAGPFFCTLMAFHLVDENAPSKKLKDLVVGRYGYAYDHDKTGAKIEEKGFRQAADYGLRDARFEWLIRQAEEPLLDREAVRSVFELEMALLPVLVDMRLTGAHVDEGALRELEEELAADLDGAREKVHIAAGAEFNLNSPPQRSKILYGPPDEGGQGLKCRNRTSTGAMSTDKDALEHHRGNAVVDALLEFAAIDTLQSTYVHAYLGNGKKPGALINGRIHTDFVQYGTVTGRCSSRDPNLQNIPRPDQPRSKRVRGLFTAAEGCKLIVGDYGQIELRILAHFCGKGGLFEGFLAGVDAHVATAAALFKCAFEQVTKLMRQIAKAVNFAIVFGAGPDTVAAMSGVSLKEAKGFMAIHERAFPEVYSFRERVLGACRSSADHSVRTLLGRKRRVPEIVSRQDGFRHRAERQAFNAKIQGSNGDLNKLAMIRAHERLPEGAKLILTIHDELVVEAAQEVVREAEAALREAMLGEEIQKLLSVPLVSDLVVCDRWSEAK